MSDLSVDQLQYPTDYNLQSIGLFTSGADSALDLTSYLVELNFFEDLYNNSISGKLVISEAIGLVQLAGLNGTEFLKIKFTKAGDSTVVIDRIFRVFSITNRSVDMSNLFDSYTINFCSEEFLLSEQYRLSKSYKNTKISDIIKSIMRDYLKVGVDKTSKQVYIDDTMGVYDFVLPNKKLFETINWLSNYAMSDASTPGADMVFYENSNGYHFHSLQNLFTQKPIAKYFYNPKNVVTTETGYKDINQQIYNVYKFEIVNYFDTLSATSRGTFSNRLISLDIIAKKKTITDFNYAEYYQKSKKLNSSPLVNNYSNRQGKRLYDEPPKDLEAGALKMVSSNAAQQDSPWVKDRPGNVGHNIFIENFMTHRPAQMALANYNKVKITIPGNPQMSVGLTIDFVFLATSVTADDGQKIPDPFLSGKYLITAVRHVITNIAHLTVLELSKESGSRNYAAVENDTNWKSIVNGNQS